MRLRTLPVSVAGVFMAVAFAILYHTFYWVPAMLCLLFAVLAQIASNFANEYYDYKRGLDRPGREGPRRGVTEGDITPEDMRNATFITLGLACAVGCMLLLFGGWWLIIVGAAIALGVVAYSAGPFPLSHHGLGEVAVMLFFGIIPVNFTYYLESGTWNLMVALASVAVGLMGANVIIVNNYRDRDDDAAVGKRTLAVRFGKPAMMSFYLTNGYVAVCMMAPIWLSLSLWACIVPVAYLLLHTLLWWRIANLSGHKLNPYLGKTAVLMLLYSIAFVVVAIILS